MENKPMSIVLSEVKNGIIGVLNNQAYLFMLEKCF